MSFNLSSKIIDTEYYSEIGKIFVKDVKEFIRLLKEKIKDTEYQVDPKKLYWEDVAELIDTLAGDKLL